MKTKIYSGAALVLGSCLWFAVSGYGGAGHDHDHAPKAPAGAAASTSTSSFIVDDALKEELGIEIGEVEMQDIPGVKETWIAVPPGAISNRSSDGEKAIVYLAEDSGKAGAKQSFAPAEVEVGESKGGYVEITSGLLPGDTVIVKNASQIGVKSKVEDADTTGEPSKESALGTVVEESAEPDGVVTKPATAFRIAALPETTKSDREPVVECDSRCPLEATAKPTCVEDSTQAFEGCDLVTRDECQFLRSRRDRTRCFR